MYSDNAGNPPLPGVCLTTRALYTPPSSDSSTAMVGHWSHWLWCTHGHTGVCPTGESQSVVAGVTEPSRRVVSSVVGDATRIGCDENTV